jgi:hypothetical protein
MPSFRVHFATEPHEPFPPLDELPEVEAAEPLDAVHQLVETGRHPQNRPLNWARVVLNTHDDGKPRQVLRVQVSPARKVQVDWQPPAGNDNT